MKTISSEGGHFSGRGKQATSVRVQTVLKTIATDEVTRRRVMAEFKGRGGLINRWSKADQVAMRDALIRAEDMLELERPNFTSMRTALRTVRRRLEACCE